MPIATVIRTGALVPRQLAKDPSVVRTGKQWRDVLSALAERTQYYGTTLACVANSDDEAFVRWMEHRAALRQDGVAYLERTQTESELAARRHFERLTGPGAQPAILASLCCHARPPAIVLDPEQLDHCLAAKKEVGAELRCPVVGCGCRLTTREEVVEHANAHSIPDLWRCPTCGEVADSLLLLWAHVTDFHRHQGAMRCAFCNAAFVSQDRLVAHTQRVHEGESAVVEALATPADYVLG